MNQSQAIAKLRKTLGAKFAYRVDKDAPDAEQREEILNAWRAAKQIADDAEAARAARYAEILKDPLYQDLKAKATEAKAAASKAGAGAHRKRITVGRDMGFIFSVEAAGDNWDEVVASVTKKEPA